MDIKLQQKVIFFEKSFGKHMNGPFKRLKNKLQQGYPGVNNPGLYWKWTLQYMISVSGIFFHRASEKKSNLVMIK